MPRFDHRNDPTSTTSPAAADPASLDTLVEALGVAAGQLDTDQRRAALTTYRLLAEGSPVTEAAVADATELPEDLVASYFAEWEGVFRDRAGGIVGFWGLALQPLDPRYDLIDHDTGRSVGHAWCAWDTLFLPSLLDRTLEVYAADGRTGEPIDLVVTPNGATHVRPERAVVSFVVPDAPWEADFLTTFCHKVLFFTDRAAADRWIADRPDNLFVLTVDEAFEVGRRWTRTRYADTLDSLHASGALVDG